MLGPGDAGPPKSGALPLGPQSLLTKAGRAIYCYSAVRWVSNLSTNKMLYESREQYFCLGVKTSNIWSRPAVQGASFAHMGSELFLFPVLRHLFNILICRVLKYPFKNTIGYYYIPITMTKIQIMPPPNIPSSMEWPDLSFFPGGNAKWKSYFEKQFGTFLQAKPHLNIWSSNLTPTYLPKWIENLWSHTNLRTDIHSSFTHNGQNLAATKVSFK